MINKTLYAILFISSLGAIMLGLLLACEAILETKLEGEILEEELPITEVLKTPIPTPTPILTSPLNLSEELESYINETAELYNLDPTLVRAVIYTESRGVTDADNGLCYGLMQLNRQYAEAFMEGAEVATIIDPKDNIKAGCWWLSELISWAKGDEALALAAYNLGQTEAKYLWEIGERSTKYTKLVYDAKEELFI